MVGRVLSLYVRAGVGVANLALRAAARGAELAVGAVRMVTPSATQPEHGASEDVFGRSAEPRSETPHDVVEPSREIPEPPVDVAEASPAVAEESTDVAAQTARPIDEAGEKTKTIDDEPELVAEFAEPGAEEGAGAELEVDEPWEGYDDLTADEVVARIGDADAAGLAVIELYERSHKQRRSVLSAAERRERELANAPS